MRDNYTDFILRHLPTMNTIRQNDVRLSEWFRPSPERQFRQCASFPVRQFRQRQFCNSASFASAPVSPERQFRQCASFARAPVSPVRQFCQFRQSSSFAIAPVSPERQFRNSASLARAPVRQFRQSASFTICERNSLAKSN